MSGRVLRYSLGAGIGALLLLPFLVLIGFASSWRLPLTAELGEVFFFTASQALFSALVSMIFGIVGGLGLLWAGRFGGRRSRILEAIVLLPNVAPVLLMILAALKAFPGLRGITGIVTVHVLLNAGLVSVAFARLVRDKVSGMAELAWVEGATGFKFFRRGVLPYLKHDLLTLALFVFAICFSSFAVPLIIGGSRATTLEVLIYQKLRISADWAEAIGIATLQLVAILVLSWALRRETGTALAARPSETPLLSWKWGAAFAMVPGAILVWGMVDGFTSGLQQLNSLGVWGREMPLLLYGSIKVGFGTGAASALLLLLIAYVNPTGAYRKFLLGYVAPSTVLMGFALLIAWRATGFATYFKIIAGLTLITVPSFYRLQWDNTLRSLEGQRTVARVLGAGDFLVFRDIILPQVLRSALFIAGIASLWAWGDFAFSAVVAEKDVTVAMLAQGLMESYRLDAATVLVWVVSAGGVLSFLLFNGVARVVGSKSQT